MGRKRKQSVLAIFLILFNSFFSTVEYAGAETINENNKISVNCENSNDANLVVSEGAITSGGAIASGSAVTSGGAVVTNSAIQPTIEPPTSEDDEYPYIKGDACATSIPGVIPIVSQKPVTKEPEVTKVPEISKTPIVTVKPQTTFVPEITKAPIITQTPVVTKIPNPTPTPVVLPEETPVLTKEPIPVLTKEPTPVVTIVPTQNEEAQTPSKPTMVPVERPNVSATQKPVNDTTTASVCTVHYVLNGGKNHAQNPKKIVNMDITINLHNAKKRGYLFKGWYTESYYKNRITRIGNTGKSSITLYAKWKKVSVAKAGISSAKSLKGGKVRVKIKKKETVKGYEYMYSTSPTFLKKYRVRTTKNPKILSKLKKGTVYYIKVRSYKIDSYGKKVYGKYSKVVKCKIKKK